MRNHSVWPFTLKLFSNTLLWCSLSTWSHGVNVCFLLLFFNGEFHSLAVLKDFCFRWKDYVLDIFKVNRRAIGQGNNVGLFRDQSHDHVNANANHLCLKINRWNLFPPMNTRNVQIFHLLFIEQKTRARKRHKMSLPLNPTEKPVYNNIFEMFACSRTLFEPHPI